MAPVATEVKFSKKESLHFNLWRVIESYTETYSRCPKTTDDLTMYIDRVGDDYKMINQHVYQVLKRNEHDLIFVTTADSVTTIYKGIVKKNRIVERADFVGPCGSLRTSTLNLFDSQGYYFEDESLTKQINEALKGIYIAYREHLKPTPDVHRTGSPYDKIIVEFTLSGTLRDLCNGSYIDLSQSEFYSEIYNCLHKIASDNNLSRIITPTYVD
jgi:hypothetical protein